MEALNQLEEGLKENIKKLSSFDLYKQEVLLGHLDWSPMHKDPSFWRDNITRFEDNDFQVLFDFVHHSLLSTATLLKKPIQCLPILLLPIFCFLVHFVTGHPIYLTS